MGQMRLWEDALCREGDARGIRVTQSHLPLVNKRAHGLATP